MIRFATAAALSMSLALPAAAFDVGAMTEDERAAFRSEIRAYLLDNPEVIIEAVNLLEERQAQAQASNDDQLVERFAQELFEDADSWVGGNPDGDITIVEFVDYRCGYCRRAHDEVAALVEGDGDIRLVVKEFPILGENSLASSRFAIAARLIGGDAAYKLAHDALIAYSADMSDATMRRLAVSLDLDADAILDKMNSPEVTEIILRNRQLAQKMDINGTPTFVVQGTMLRGYVPLPGMQQVVKQQREES